MSDDGEEEVARAFRPGRRPGWIAAGLNATLALMLLGIPYVRGKLRATDAGAHYAALAQCMYGGRAVDEPGLALPPGDREAFAARVARADASWPEPCIAELRAMRPEPVIFLFPSPKQAEEDLRRAIDQAEAELVALQRARTEEGGVGAVPERPLRALTQLRSALANLFTASDVTVDPNAPAIALDADPTIVAPSRIPTRTAASGVTQVRPEPGGLRAITSDGRSVSEAAVRDGRVDFTQVRRPPAVRGITLGPESGFLLWITSETTCATDAQHCAARLLGIAPMRDVSEPTPRWWVAAHPAGRIDRAVRVEPGGVVRVIAVGEGGEGREMRRFVLDPDAPEPASEDQVTPIVASERVALDDAIDALLVPGGVVRAWRDAGALWIAGAGIEPAMEVPLPGEGEERPAPRQVALARCGAWTAVAMPDGVVVLDGARALAPITQALREPVLGASREDDAVRIACHDEGADLLAIDRRRRVLRWACTTEGCGEPQVVAEGASQMDAAHGGGTTLVAWTGNAQRPQVRVARVRGDVIGAPEVPAPCWAGPSGGVGEGLCGPPTVVAEGERVLVTARDPQLGDLLVLELADVGFARLPGL
ncbi:hypothetical protein [Sandaracinus amylolyticus]|uniref:Uncharacterized protein n=1 Tax=Sandaracinus amylolyticus TaxID=927083 RepID=A0A0F6YJ37_9BACT|nr:hypothetical protein [Sandaracinus amylolyticus]AKF06920.1 hypothetical protein DB32_004069 [Sandaracinus amylolyticus]